jgi:hypothetical protein
MINGKRLPLLLILLGLALMGLATYRLLRPTPLVQQVARCSELAKVDRLYAICYKSEKCIITETELERYFTLGNEYKDMCPNVPQVAAPVEQPKGPIS